MPRDAEIGEALCRILRQGRDVHRCFAAQALGRIGYAGATDALIESLLDADEDVRVDAAEALGLLGDERAGRALLENLIGDPSGDVKVNAVVALGRLKETDAIPVLRQLVRGRDDSVIWDEAANFNGGWDDWLDVQVKAVEALGDMGAVEAVPDIVAAMADEMGQDLSGTGMRALGKLGEPGIRALADCLEIKDDRLRRRAVRVLSEIDSEAAGGALARGLTDESADVRLGAVCGLARRNAGDPRLTPLFDDTDPGVRAAMAKYCGGRWPERLAALLDDPSDRVQVAVLECLAADPGLPQPENLDFRLRVKLRGPSERVAVSACRALAVLAADSAVDDLCEQLQDRNCPVEVRRAAAKGLGEIATDRAARALRDAVGEEARQVRIEAVAALSRIAAGQKRPSLAAETLLAALRGELALSPVTGPAPETPEREKTAAADLAVGDTPNLHQPSGENSGRRHGPSGKAEALAEDEATVLAEAKDEVLAEPAPSAEPPWPKSTLEALTGEFAGPKQAPVPGEPVELGEQELEFLALARRMPRKKRVSPEPKVPVHEDVRRLAARVLGDVASENVVRALVEAVNDTDAELRRTAADSLARLAERMGGLPAEAGAALEAVLDDPDRDLRLAAIRALGKTKRDVAPALVAKLEDGDSYVRAEAARGIAAAGAVGPEVAGLLRDDDPGVRLAAAEALASKGGAEVVARLVDFAFTHDGVHRRQAASLLRDLDRAAASERFLETLGDPRQERNWRVAVEALEELHRSDAAAIVGP